MQRIYIAGGASGALAAALIVPALHGLMTSNDRSRLDAPVVASGDDLFPPQTASDWATFADHIVTVHITSEEELPATDQEVAIGEGIILQRLTFAVDSVEWSRTDAPPVPDALTWDEFGWSFTGSERSPMSLEGLPDLAPGHEYLVPVVLLPDNRFTGEGGWSPLGGATMFSYDNDSLGNGPHVVGTPEPSFTQRLEGVSADVVVARVEGAPPLQVPTARPRQGALARLRAAWRLDD